MAERANVLDVPVEETRPAAKLPPERMAPLGDKKGQKAGTKQGSSARERHPLYDPRQRKLLDELEAEDAAENKRQAEMRAAEERMKEELLRELSGQDASQQVGLSLEPVPPLAANTAIATPTSTPAPVEAEASPTPEPSAEPLASSTPVETTTPNDTTPIDRVSGASATEQNDPPNIEKAELLPPLDGGRTPSSPWSRAGTFPRIPISQQAADAPPLLPPTAEQLARAAEDARRVRLEWLQANMGCKELLGEIKTRYSDVRPAGGFSREVKLDLWEVLNTACSARFARCKFPQCSKLQKLTAQTDAARAAEDEAKALAHEQLTTAARSDLDAEVRAKENFSTTLIRDAQALERQEKRVWQKVQMESEILDRARPTAEAKAEPTPVRPPNTAQKGQYDPTLYADPRDLDRTPRPAGGATGNRVSGKMTSEQRVKASQKPPVTPNRAVPAGGAPPPGRIF